MPHFIIDCSENVLNLIAPATILQEVYDIALSSGLFASEGVGGIKVRIRPFEHYTTVNSDNDFVHIFANIMEGRTVDQKSQLSHLMVKRLSELLPGVEIISMNVREFEKSTYCNRSMV